MVSRVLKVRPPRDVRKARKKRTHRTGGLARTGFVANAHDGLWRGPKLDVGLGPGYRPSLGPLARDPNSPAQAPSASSVGDSMSGDGAPGAGESPIRLCQYVRSPH